MKFLSNIHNLVVNHKANHVSVHVIHVHNQHMSKVINGNFKVVPSLHSELKQLDKVFDDCKQMNKQNQKQYAKDTALWNECRTGYANPYTAPIKH